MERGTQRLRQEAERVRAANRTSRLLGQGHGSCDGDGDGPPKTGRATFADPEPPPPAKRIAPCSACSPLACAVHGPSPTSAPRPESACSAVDRRCKDIRRRIAELDEETATERRRLDKSQREAEERQRQQDEFERQVHERTEEILRVQRELNAEDMEQHAHRSEELRKGLEDRTRRRREQRTQEEVHSRTLREARADARAEGGDHAWRAFEEQLDKQWAAEESDERLRLDAYARRRRRQYEEWDRQLTAERRRLGGGDAEFRDAARAQMFRNAAREDECFYAPRRAAAPSTGAARLGTKAQAAQQSRPALAAEHERQVDAAPTFGPDESAVLRELQGVRAAAREVQKATVKDLLFRWHPDKNPSCQDKATRLFQFVQSQRALVLGL